LAEELAATGSRLPEEKFHEFSFTLKNVCEEEEHNCKQSIAMYCAIAGSKLDDISNTVLPEIDPGVGNCRKI
jgi:hypothetical protein